MGNGENCACATNEQPSTPVTEGASMEKECCGGSGEGCKCVPTDATNEQTAMEHGHDHLCAVE